MRVSDPQPLGAEGRAEEEGGCAAPYDPENDTDRPRGSQQS